MVKFQDIVPYMDEVREKLMKALDAFGENEKGLREYPSGILPYDEAVEKLNQVRDTTKQLITKLVERNTNELRFPHPYGFELNAAQWAHFIAIHEASHIKQLGRIREANNK
ncbi:DinB family protein [Paenibacillus solani]|uniref:DinB family protein n=1 Tax=Paenibacillus solani TaxID=1705565 RepID=UPI003D2CE2EC